MIKTLLSLPTGVKIYLIIYFPICIPFIVTYLFSKNKSIISQDLLARKEDNYIYKQHLILSLILCLILEPEFRNVFYLRVGGISFILNKILRPVECVLGSNTVNIQGGLYIVHGFGIVINGAAKIGKNCTILHSVTIGVAKGKSPIIGDNVYIGAGAIIIGGVTVGNNVKIGAGAIVVDDVPDNCTCVCNKASIK